MHAIDALAHQALRSHERIDSLGRASRTSALRRAAVTAALNEYGASSWSSKSTAARPASGKTLSGTRGSLAGNRACISKSDLRVRATWAAIPESRTTARLILNLAHRDCAHHLNRIGRGRLSELPCGGTETLLVFTWDISVALILIVPIEADLLKGAPPAALPTSLALANPAGPAWLSKAPSRPPARCRRGVVGRSRARRGRICGICSSLTGRLRFGSFVRGRGVRGN
jgi:hypothetical protein